MKNIKTLSDKALIQRTEIAARLERRSLARFLSLLAEVRARRLYLELGFSSLFAYLHEGLGYSESQSYERMRACELSVKVPVVAEKIEAGQMSLTVAAKLASHLRREGTSAEEASQLAEQLTSCSIKQTERILVQVAKNPEPLRESIRPKSAEFSQVSFDADAELVALIEEARNLLAESSIAEIVRAGLKAVVAKKRKQLGIESSATEKRKSQELRNQENIQEKHIRPIHSRYIPMKDRRKVYAHSKGQCEFVSLQTKRRCSSEFGPEFDHIQPFALDGVSRAENLRHLCKAHNERAARLIFGDDWMELFRSLD